MVVGSDVGGGVVTDVGSDVGAGVGSEVGASVATDVGADVDAGVAPGVASSVGDAVPIGLGVDSAVGVGLRPGLGCDEGVELGSAVGTTANAPAVVSGSGVDVADAVGAGVDVVVAVAVGEPAWAANSAPTRVARKAASRHVALAVVWQAAGTSAPCQPTNVDPDAGSACRTIGRPRLTIVEQSGGQFKRVSWATTLPLPVPVRVTSSGTPGSNAAVARRVVRMGITHCSVVASGFAWQADGPLPVRLETKKPLSAVATTVISAVPLTGAVQSVRQVRPACGTARLPPTWPATLIVMSESNVAVTVKWPVGVTVQTRTFVGLGVQPAQVIVLVVPNVPVSVTCRPGETAAVHVAVHTVDVVPFH